MGVSLKENHLQLLTSVFDNIELDTRQKKKKKKKKLKHKHVENK